MGLEDYRKKRDFDATEEPRGEHPGSSANALSFCVQKHDASHMHFDFRLEWNGVLLSWAVPKGPSLDPQVNRLAIHVEDHPVEYGDFEGNIPSGEYGGGTVMLWDEGTWVPDGDVPQMLKKGRLKFALHGSRLKGKWFLFRGTSHSSARQESWYLKKEHDQEARKEGEFNIEETFVMSVRSGRSFSEISQDSDAVWSGLPNVEKKSPAATSSF